MSLQSGLLDEESANKARKFRTESIDPDNPRPSSRLRQSTGILLKGSRGVPGVLGGQASEDARPMRVRLGSMSMTDSELLDDSRDRRGPRLSKLGKLFATPSRDGESDASNGLRDGDQDERPRPRSNRSSHRLSSRLCHGPEFPLPPTRLSSSHLEHSAGRASSSSTSKSLTPTSTRLQTTIRADQITPTGSAPQVPLHTPLSPTDVGSPVSCGGPIKASNSAIFKQLSPELLGLSPRMTGTALTEWLKLGETNPSQSSSSRKLACEEPEEDFTLEGVIRKPNLSGASNELGPSNGSLPASPRYSQNNLSRDNYSQPHQNTVDIGTQPQFRREASDRVRAGLKERERSFVPFHPTKESPAKLSEADFSHELDVDTEDSPLSTPRAPRSLHIRGLLREKSNEPKFLKKTNSAEPDYSRHTNKKKTGSQKVAAETIDTHDEIRRRFDDDSQDVMVKKKTSTAKSWTKIKYRFPKLKPSGQ